MAKKSVRKYKVSYEDRIIKILKESGKKITYAPYLLKLGNLIFYGLEIKNTGNIVVYYRNENRHYKGIRTKKLDDFDATISKKLYNAMTGGYKDWKEKRPVVDKDQLKLWKEQ